MSIPRRGATAALALALLAGGCAPRATQGGGAGPSVTVVEVHNGHWENLTVYLQRNGQVHRLGRVWGLERAVLEIPSCYCEGGSDVALLAGPGMGAPTISSGYFPIAPGDRIRWDVRLGDAPVRVRPAEPASDAPAGQLRRGPTDRDPAAP